MASPNIEGTFRKQKVTQINESKIDLKNEEQKFCGIFGLGWKNNSCNPFTKWAFNHQWGIGIVEETIYSGHFSKFWEHSKQNKSCVQL